MATREYEFNKETQQYSFELGNPSRVIFPICDLFFQFKKITADHNSTRVQDILANFIIGPSGDLQSAFECKAGITRTAALRLALQN